MSTQTMRARVDRLEKKMCPKNERGFTVVEACRLLWQLDKDDYLDMAVGEPLYRRFVQQFEAEDEERQARALQHASAGLKAPRGGISRAERDGRWNNRVGRARSPLPPRL